MNLTTTIRPESTTDHPAGLMCITTPRLELIAATTALLEMELESPQRLGAALGVQVPDGWPPGEYDENAIRWLLDRLKAQAEAAGWFAWYALLKAEPGARPHLVAAGGYTGPPDEEGKVEIGYSVVPAFGRRGIATEMVAALVQHAFAAARITRIIAHTFPTNVASIRVLEKNGFALEGPGAGEGTIRYARERTTDRGNGGCMEFLESGEGTDIVTTRVLHAPRELVFRAWTEPEHLARWWGPTGFTNTFSEYDLRPGGKWIFVMHGPEGGNYNNECTFMRIEPPGFIAWEHISPPYFHVLARFDEVAGGKTQLTWTMRFRTAEECGKIRAFVTGKNEENLDRLDVELAAMR